MSTFSALSADDPKTFLRNLGAHGAHFSKRFQNFILGAHGAEGADKCKEGLRGRSRENFPSICTICTFWLLSVENWVRCRWCRCPLTFLCTRARVKLYGEVHQVHPAKSTCFSGGDF